MKASGRILFAGLSSQATETAMTALGGEFQAMHVVQDTAELLELCEGSPPEVVLVGEHGQDDAGRICREVRTRTHNQTAILAFVSSIKDYGELLAGPLDDVICEPADAAQILARVRARKACFRPATPNDLLHQRAIAVRHLAHDVRSPLNAIFLLAEMLAQEDINPDLTQDARDILESADMASGLLEGLSGLMRLNTVDERFTRMRVDLTALAHKACNRPYLRHHTSLEGGVQVVVQGDPRALAQAIGDLLLNVFFISERKGRAKVTLHEEGQFAVLRVSHPGISTSHEIFRKLLDPTGAGTVELRQNHMSVSAVGLNYASHVAQMHGGDLRLETAPDGSGRAALRVLRSPEGLLS